MFTLKLFGAVCAGASCMIYSMEVYKKAHQKCRAREDIIKILAELEKAIPRQRALCELFPESCGLPCELTNMLCLSSEKPLYDALLYYPPFSLLDADEKIALQSFATNLGTYPCIDDELYHCKEALRFMEGKKVHNNVRDLQRASLYLKLGGLSAASLLIILG